VAPDPRRRLPVNEAALLAYVRDLCAVRKWRVYHTHDSRHSPAGFPDLVMVRPPRLVFAELKAGAHLKPTPAQAEWLLDLTKVGEAFRHAAGGLGVETYLWNPDHLDEIQKVLW